MASESEVALQVRWLEAGADVPVRTAANMRLLQNTTDNSVGTVNRLGTAFESLERREPSMALRRSVFALESLAASSLGAEGAVGRLGGAFLLLGAGSVTGLAILGGIAAIGEAYKFLTADARAAAEQTKKLHDEVSSLASAGSEAKQIHRGAETGQAQKDLADAEKKLVDLHIAYNREVLASQAPIVAIAGTQKEHADAVERVRKAWQDQVNLVHELRGALTDLNRPGELSAVTVEGRPTVGLPAWALAAAGALTFDTPEQISARAAGLVGRGTSPRNLFPLDSAGRVLEMPGDKGNVPIGREDKEEVDRGGERLAKSIGREIGPLIAFAANIGRGSGGGAALAGLAGITGTLASLPSLAGAATPLGVVSGVLSGLTSLFSGGKAKVTLASMEQDALESFKKAMSEVRGDFQNFSLNVAGSGDMRMTAYLLNRQTQRDAVVRVPFGG